MADLPDDLTEELRRVYDESWDGIDHFGDHDAALLAVARHVARMQRDMEPTGAMLSDGCHFDAMDENSDIGADVNGIYLAMQRAAPLVTDREEP